VVVNRKAGETILRGAHVFVPGVLACSGNMAVGDRVAGGPRLPGAGSGHAAVACRQLAWRPHRPATPRPARDRDACVLSWSLPAAAARPMWVRGCCLWLSLQCQWRWSCRAAPRTASLAEPSSVLNLQRSSQGWPGTAPTCTWVGGAVQRSRPGWQGPLPSNALGAPGGAGPWQQCTQRSLGSSHASDLTCWPDTRCAVHGLGASGIGVAEMGRTDVFKTTHGVAVRMERRVYEVPALSGGSLPPPSLLCPSLQISPP